MKIFITIVANMTVSAEDTIYENLGEKEGIEAAVDRFYERVLDDDRLAGFFEDSDMDRLRTHQTLFLTMVTGGPEEYEGRDMRAAHEGLDITEEEFGLVADHLAATLAEFDVPDEQADAILMQVAGLKDEIVGQ